MHTSTASIRGLGEGIVEETRILPLDTLSAVVGSQMSGRVVVVVSALVLKEKREEDCDATRNRHQKQKNNQNAQAGDQSNILVDTEGQFVFEAKVILLFARNEGSTDTPMATGPPMPCSHPRR